MEHDENAPLRTQVAPIVGLPFLVRARQLAAGSSSGTHRSLRKGSGIEFAGHRNYYPGDDLRHLDQHALLRHGKLLVREFYTETDRSVHLIVDVSDSMAYAGDSGPTKASHALLLAAALCFLAKKTGDHLGLTLLGNDADGSSFAPPRSGRAAFERTLVLLERAHQRLGHALAPPRGTETRERPTTSELWASTLKQLALRLPRGTVIFVLSDFLDMTPSVRRACVYLATKGRSVRAAQVLSRNEAEFPFTGSFRLVDPETGYSVETEAKRARNDYLEALEQLTEPLARDLGGLGGLFLRVLTSDPLEVPLAQLAQGSRP